jgi:GMP synthase PP-ATPase subunit
MFLSVKSVGVMGDGRNYDVSSRPPSTCANAAYRLSAFDSAGVLMFTVEAYPVTAVRFGEIEHTIRHSDRRVKIRQVVSRHDTDTHRDANSRVVA